ncbi:flagellar biosynthetic protein FliR [Collimonas sp. H4R21]|uniref:Flagellar biosynthetic protein FliR n=1 Tax=Collimonas rhizosphaerae TaxID=3126357 RepID=A0ABU9PYP6_9BURK
MSSFGDLAHGIMTLALLVTRGYGMLLAIPMLMKAGQGRLLRLPIALAIALPAFIPVYQVSMQDFSMSNTALLVLREFFLGALAGVFFFPLFAVPRAAGTLVDQQAGLMSIQLFDPTSAERSSTVFADLFEQCALFLFVTAGGFSVLSEMYAVSYFLWPVTAVGFPSAHDIMMLIQEGSSQMLAGSIVYAAPMVVVLIALEYGIGLVGRAAPQINILTTAVAIKMVAVALVLLVGAPHFVDEYQYAMAALLHGGEAFLKLTLQK